MSEPAAGLAQRVDKWLWSARIFKTRTLAAKMVSDGGFRITRGSETVRIDKPSALVRPGDRLAFLINGRMRVLEIRACAERRGPASEAQALYTDQSPPPDRSAAPSAGGARPTKKDRREIARLKGAQ